MKIIQFLIPAFFLWASCSIPSSTTTTESAAKQQSYPSKNSIKTPMPQTVNNNLENDPIVYEKGIFILKVGQTTVPKDSFITTDRRDSLINEYWNFKGEKKYFMISLEELDDLYNDSKNGKVMVKVTNIDDLKRVKAEWMPYDKDLIVKSMTRTPNYYFVMDRWFLDADYNDPKGINGIRYAKEKNQTLDIQTKAICARLGKKGDKYYLLINSTYIYFITDTGGTGAPEPPGSGVGIPDN